MNVLDWKSYRSDFNSAPLQSESIQSSAAFCTNLQLLKNCRGHFLCCMSWSWTPSRLSWFQFIHQSVPACVILSLPPCPAAPSLNFYGIAKVDLEPHLTSRNTCHIHSPSNGGPTYPRFQLLQLQVFSFQVLRLNFYGIVKAVPEPRLTSRNTCHIQPPYGLHVLGFNFYSFRGLGFRPKCFWNYQGCSLPSP